MASVTHGSEARSLAAGVTMSDSKVAIRIENLCKTFPGSMQRAVDGLSLEIPEGKLFTLLGPSGCGKSTTLRMVAGLEDPDAGAIYFGDQPVVMTDRNIMVPPEKRNVGMVFQSYAIWPHMTVEENVAFPLKARKFRRSEIKSRVSKALELVGMANLEKRPAPLLSGGQQQRVALARAISTEPRVLLLDEPFSNLDAKLREQMRIELKQLQRQLDVTVLFVTHDQVEALSLSDRVALIKDGVIQQQGDPRTLYELPVNEFVRDFLGTTLLLKGRVIETGDGEHSQVRTAVDGAPNCVIDAHSHNLERIEANTPVLISVRPDDIEVLPAAADASSVPEGMLGGTVQTVMFIGERNEYQVEVEGQKVMTITGNRHYSIMEGDWVWIKLWPEGHTAWPNI